MIDIVEQGYLGDAPIIYNGRTIDNPFINYCREDKSKYTTASEVGYNDPDSDFLIGESGGILMNINFIFVNVHEFCEAADHFRKHKVYSFSKPGTREYVNFWREETIRRKNGLVKNCKLLHKDVLKYNALLKMSTADNDIPSKTAAAYLKPLRITGDHYHFVNYSRMKRGLTVEERNSGKYNARTKKISDFPLFIDGQYWDHKIDEFCILNDLNICESKARRKGFTYAKASRSANIVNLYKNTMIINLAYDEKFVIGGGSINQFSYKNLQWLEEHTYWKRGFIKEQYSEIKLGFKKQRQGNKIFGHQSTILGASVSGNTSAGVGKDGNEINLEESGKNRVLEEVLGVTLSAAEDGSEKVGIIRVFGTGGAKDADWVQFSKCFYNPAIYEMVKLENVWDDNRRNTVCGFFYPQMWAYFPYIKDGNSLLLGAYEHDAIRKDAARKEMNSKDYSIFVGQRANAPQEAFINTLDNIFSSVALTEHLTYLQNNEELKYYKDGWVDIFDKEVKFLPNEELIKKGLKKREYIEDVPFNIKTDITGAVRMYHPPYTGSNNVPPKDSYIVVYDPYGIDKKVKDIILKNSLACIYVIGLRNAEFPFHEDKICAAYVGRMNTMEEADMMAIHLADLYNAKIVAELNRGTMLQTAKKFGRKKLLAKDISDYMEDYEKDRKESYGVVIGSGDNKLDLLGQMSDWLYQVVSVDEDGKPTYVFQRITDIPFIKELTVYNSINNFDRVSTYLVGIKHMKYFALKHYRSSKTNAKRDVRSNTKSLSSILLGR